MKAHALIALLHRCHAHIKHALDLPLRLKKSLLEQAIDNVDAAKHRSVLHLL